MTLYFETLDYRNNICFDLMSLKEIMRYLYGNIFYKYEGDVFYEIFYCGILSSLVPLFLTGYVSIFAYEKSIFHKVDKVNPENSIPLLLFFIAQGLFYFILVVLTIKVAYRNYSFKLFIIYLVSIISVGVFLAYLNFSNSSNCLIFFFCLAIGSCVIATVYSA